MRQTYNIQGMSCTHCISRVQKALSEHPEIAKAEVALSPPQAVLTQTQEIPIAELQALITKAGGYLIEKTS